MKPNQRLFTKRNMLAALLAGSGILAASAYAVTADTTADRPRCEAKHGHAFKAERESGRAAHLATLKDKLQLTPEQEPAWNSFVEASEPKSRPPVKDRQAMREAFAEMSTPERLERMQAMMEMRRARMAERIEAVKAFYAQLTPAQQSVFDDEAMAHRGHRMHHRHGQHS